MSLLTPLLSNGYRISHHLDNNPVRVPLNRIVLEYATYSLVPVLTTSLRQSTARTGTADLRAFVQKPGR